MRFPKTRGSIETPDSRAFIVRARQKGPAHGHGQMDNSVRICMGLPAWSDLRNTAQGWAWTLKSDPGAGGCFLTGLAILAV